MVASCSYASAARWAYWNTREKSSGAGGAVGTGFFPHEVTVTPVNAKSQMRRPHRTASGPSVNIFLSDRVRSFLMREVASGCHGRPSGQTGKSSSITIGERRGSSLRRDVGVFLIRIRISLSPSHNPYYRPFVREWACAIVLPTHLRVVFSLIREAKAGGRVRLDHSSKGKWLFGLEPCLT